jgi:hypothetical protein
MDFFTVPTLTGRVLFVLVLLAHDRRRVVHVTVTEHPTAEMDCTTNRGYHNARSQPLPLTQAAVK